MQPPAQQHDSRVIEEIKKNMELPEALKFRSNTGNRAYGFEQTIEKGG
jgi:hypothetical protein